MKREGRDMKIEELSVGDWVMNLYANKPSRVIGLRTMFQDTYEIIAVSDDTQYMLIEDNEELHNYEPIPITPEILEKNGFERGEYSEIRVYNEWEIGEWDNPPYVSVKLDIDRQVIRVTNRGRDMFIADKEVYVHQLQHALRLAGVEKEIEL